MITVPQIFAQIYSFSKLTHLCNQALDAILESQIQEQQINTIDSAPLSEFQLLTVMAQDTIIDNSEQLYGAAEFTIPKQISVKSYYLFTTIVTVDRRAISVLPDVLQIEHFPNFNLIAPCWAQALDAQYFTVSSELISGARCLALSKHVQTILAAYYDCIRCQSFSALEDVTRYHLRHGQSFLRVSRDFAVSVHLRSESQETLLDAIRLFLSHNLVNVLKFLDRFCSLRLSFDTVDLHPTYQRFQLIAQNNLYCAFLSICHQRFPDLLQVSADYDSSSDSDFSDSEIEIFSDNELSARGTQLDELASDSSSQFSVLDFPLSVSDNSSQLSDPPEWNTHEDDLAVQFPRSIYSSPVLPPSGVEDGSRSSRNLLFPDQRSVPPIRDNDRFSLDNDNFILSGNPLRLSFRTYLIRFISATPFESIYKSFDHWCDDSDARPDSIFQLISQMTAIDSRNISFGDLSDLLQSGASQCRSITELHGLYYHLCYVSFHEQQPRRFLNIYASPQHGTSFCLGTVHIDRIGNALHQDQVEDRTILHPFSQVHQGQYYHRVEQLTFRLRLPDVQYNVTFYQRGKEPVSFVLNKNADIAAVQTVLNDHLQSIGIASLDHVTHFAQKYSISDLTLLYTLECQGIDQIHILDYYPLTQPTVDSCTRLCFGYYNIARISQQSTRMTDRSVQQSLSTNSLQESVSSPRLYQSRNLGIGRNNRSAYTGVNFRREQSSSRSSSQHRRAQSSNRSFIQPQVPRRGVRFSPMYRIHTSAFMLFTRQDSFSAIHTEDLSRWYVADSGCQETMSLVKDHFIAATPCKVTIQTAKSGAVITATLRGKLRLPVSDDKNSAISFDVPTGLFTPDCDKPLLSIGALIESGHHVTFTPSFSGIKTATASIPFVWLRGLWWLPIRDSPPPYDINAFGAVKSTTSNALQLWHLRMGHVGIFALRNLHHVINGISPLPSQFDFPCHDCMQSKMRHRNKPESSTSTLTRPFELVHFDTLFVEKPTISGCKMDSHFIDGHTHWEVNYVHKYKTDIPDFFNQFTATVRTYRQPGSDAQYRIERIRTDNAGELTSAGMKQWFTGNQIIQELSCPYDQSQNGIPERHGGVKCQMIRGMLSTSRLPSYTWGYASYYAVYIKNRVPSSALSAKHQNPTSPYLLVFGQKPSFANLHPFGCLCWVYVSKQQSPGWKLSARGLPCVFLGLGNWQGRKAFLALDLSTRRVHATITAKFDETYFPCRPSGYRRIQNLDLDLSSISHETTSSSVSDAMDPPVMFQYEHLDEPVLSPVTLPPIATLIPEIPDDDPDLLEYDSVLLDLPQQCAVVPDPPIANVDAIIPIPPASSQPFMQFFDEEIQDQVASSFASGSSENEVTAFTVSYALAEPTDIDEPRTHAEATRSRHAEKWLEAERSEHNSLIQKEVYDTVSRPKDKQILKARPVYKIKRDSHGSILKFKVRLVVKGYLQKYGISYFDVFAPVSTVDGIRVIIAIATQRDWGIRQFDVSTAYLNAPIDEEIYVEPPPGFEEPDKKVWRLKKSLYGAKQSAKNWGEFLATVLREYGFNLASSDHYIWTTPTLYLALHVDDLAIAYANEAALEHFTVFIKSKFEINDLGELSYFLGVQIIRNRDLGITQLSQAGYIDQALLKFGMQDANIVNVPLNPGVKFSLADEPKCTEEEHELYRSLIGSANWKAVWTSPEISFAVHYLSRFLTNPAKTHLKAAQHLFRYLKGTKTFGPVYRRDPSMSPFPQLANVLYGFADSDYAGDSDTHRSTSGYLFLLNGAAVSWKTKRQEVVALSSTEAEFISLSRAGQHAVSLRALLFELGAQQHDPTIIYEDNLSCITASTNVQMRGRMKHVNVRIFYIRDLIVRDIIQAVHCPTTLQHADPFTKNLPIATFVPHRDVMHGIRFVLSSSLVSDTAKAGEEEALQ